jgi:hypothetical protein
MLSCDRYRHMISTKSPSTPPYLIVPKHLINTASLGK